jgi:hypothetical protein
MNDSVLLTVTRLLLLILIMILYRRINITTADQPQKTSLTVTRFIKNVTDSDILPFIIYNFYFYHSYY